METARKVVPLFPDQAANDVGSPAPKVRELLTETMVRAESPPPQGAPHKYVWCGVQSGFGACITSTGSRSYIFQGRKPGAKNVTRKTIAKIDAIKMKDARQRAKDMLATLLSGEDISTRAQTAAAQPYGALTLRDAYHKYIKEKPRRKATVDGYKHQFEKVLTSWHDRDFWAITKADINKRFLEIRETNGERQACLTMGLVQWMWTYLSAELPDPPPNPVDVLTQKGLWAAPVRRKRKIEAQDFAHWWNSLDKLPSAAWALYFRALVLTGCRLTEMINAEWSWWNPKKRTLTFPWQITKTGGKTKCDHVFPVGPKLAAMLEKHRESQLVDTKYIFAKPGGDRLATPKNPIFWHYRHVQGGTYTPNKQKNRKGTWSFPKGGYLWSCHDLRRTFLTMADGIGVPAGVMKVLVNHASAGVTEGYVHHSGFTVREHQERIEAAIVKLARHTARR